MNTQGLIHGAGLMEPMSREGVVEIALLMPDWQAAALEEAAHRRGLTAGQMIRRLIEEYFTKFAQPCSPKSAHPPGHSGPE